MKLPWSNAIYGVLDYVAQPAGMLLAAPVLLHRLGIASYGIWLVSSAAIGAGSIVSSGFGDVIIQRLASLRGQDNQRHMRAIVANVLTINMVLGGGLSALLWLLAPLAARHITHDAHALFSTCVWCLRVGALLIVIRSVETVFMSAQRAFESYGAAVRISTTTRLLTIVAAVGLASAGRSLIWIMLATAVIGVAGATAQWFALHSFLQHAPILPIFDKTIFHSLLAFGSFSWLQAICSVVFSQADRLLIGATLGASAVACYGICVQVAQPIHGLTAAALHFVYPHLSARSANLPLTRIRSLIAVAFAANVLLAVAFTLLVATWGPRILTAWMGSSIGMQANAILPIIAISFGLLAMNVTGHYALLAFGRFGIVTVLNTAGGLLMLFATATLWRTHGVQGAALARLCYGPCTLLMYISLSSILRSPRRRQPQAFHTTGEEA